MRQPVETQLRNYFEQIEETHGPFSTHAILDRSEGMQVIPESRTVTPPNRAIRRWAWVVALIVVGGAVIVLGATDSDTPPVDQPVTTTMPGNLIPTNGWIAFSTQPGKVQVSGTDLDVGGDIYLVRDGVDPKIIVSRGDANTTNVCPMFSPDGSMLVYGQGTDSRNALVVLAVATDGRVDEVTRIDVPLEPVAPCPAWWSPDGMRIGYIQRTTVDYPRLFIRGIDGSTPEVGAADPIIEELIRDLPDRGPLLSPDEQLIVEGGAEGLIVSNADGSGRRIIANAGYAVPGWSPDGRYVLTMEDVTGMDFRMVAHSIDEPYESVILVSLIHTNGARSWPGRGDVSWQPIYPSQ